MIIKENNFSNTIIEKESQSNEFSNIKNKAY